MAEGAFNRPVLGNAVGDNAFRQTLGGPMYSDIGGVTPPSIPAGTEQIYTVDMSSMDYANKSASTALHQLTPKALAVGADGDFYLISGTSPNNLVHEIPLGTNWDMSTFQAVSGTLNYSSQLTSAQGMDLSKDNTVLWLLKASGEIYQYSGDAGDLDSFSYDSKTYDTELINGRGIAVSYDGTKWWYARSTNGEIHQFTMSTPFDISTSSKDAIDPFLFTTSTGLADINVTTDGTKFCVLAASTTDKVFQHTMNTPNSLVGMTYDTVILDSSNEAVSPDGLAMGNGASGTALTVYVTDGTTDKVFQYD